MKFIHSFLVLALVVATQANAEPVFKVAGKTTQYKDAYKMDQAAFFDVAKKRHELIERLAQEAYLDYFWQNYAKKEGKSVEAAKKDYEKKNVKIVESEVKSTLARFKDHPQLKKLGKKEQEKQIRDYLGEKSRREMITGIIEKGLKSGDLVILSERPQEPVYDVKVTSKDQVRYGPKNSDIKPLGCKGDGCPITVVEYSEFQCPFCVKVLPGVKRVLTDYKGKVRWVMRDFPLSFHDRAKPAAVAAHCAAEQNKYWDMYSTLFENQRQLGDEDFKKYAKKIGLNVGKWEKCVKNPAAVTAVIDANIESGAKLGVTGTPAFFINGRRLSGALPFEDFKRVIDEELKKQG